MESNSGRLRKFDQVIGQVLNKNIVLNKLANKTFPNFVICEGKSGTGKSTFSEIIAMSLTCERGGMEACLQCETCKANMRALDSSGKSHVINKVNMGLVTRRDEIEELVKEIFILESMPGRNVVYVLEEFHALKPKELQIPFLEELTRVQQGVYIIICTTNVKALLDELVSRSKLTLKFGGLSREECKVLVERKCLDLGIVLSEIDKQFLISITKHSARDIVNVLDNLTDMPNFGQVLRQYFNVVQTKYYIDYIKKCHLDFTTFIIYLDDCESRIDLVDFWNGMTNFIRDSIYYLYGRGGTLFNNHEKGEIKKVLGGLNEATMQKMLVSSHIKVSDVNEAQYRLITFREIFNQPKTLVQHKIEAVTENSIAEANTIKRINEKKAVSVNLIDENLLMNLSGNQKVYSKNTKC